MKQGPARTIFTEISTALFVLLFLYTAIMKIKDMDGFIGAMNHSPVLHYYSAWLAVYIPVAELVTVLLLVIPFTRYWGLLAATTLMLIFTFYIIYILLSGQKLPCTCGGVIQQLSWTEHLALNIFFLMIGAISILLNKQLIAINRRSRTPVI